MGNVLNPDRAANAEQLRTRFCPWNAGDQGLNVKARSFVAKETRDDADRFFGDGIVDASFYRWPSYQLVHLAPPHPVTRRILACDFILIMCDAKYKRSASPTVRFGLNHVVSVAVMQELGFVCQLVAARTLF
jgi:hypothetical protein